MDPTVTPAAVPVVPLPMTVEAGSLPVAASALDARLVLGLGNLLLIPAVLIIFGIVIRNRRGHEVWTVARFFGIILVIGEAVFLPMTNYTGADLTVVYTLLGSTGTGLLSYEIGVRVGRSQKEGST